jgi:type I restriction enzyme M protein
MTKWRMTKLGDIAEVVRGSTITRKEVTPGEVPVIAGGQTPSCYHNVFNREGTTITVSASGAYAGFVQYFEIPIFASDCSTIKVKDKNEISPKFLFYVLQASQRDIYSFQRGSGQPHVYPSQLVGLDIPVPPIDEQHKIVELLEDHLSRLDAALADVKQAKIKAAQFRRSLLQAGLNGFFNNGPRDEASGLPKNWRNKTLADVADWTSGGTPSSKDSTLYGGDIPWIVIGDLTEGVVLETEKTITKKGLDSSSAKKLPVGTVMVAMYGASIGRTGVMGKEMATNQAIACGIPRDEEILGQYLLYFLQSQKNEFIAAGKGGAQPNISQGVVKSWQIPLPPIDEQLQIINEIDNQLGRLAQASNATDILLKESTALRRSLLQAAFTGQLTKEVVSV